MNGRLALLALLLALPAAALAGYQQDFEKEFLSKAWSGEQIETNVCIDCHSSDTMKPAYRTIIDDWNRSWHAQNGISCEHCHGGDPKDAVLSMTRQRGFTGSPRGADVPAFCGKCHVGILSNFLESGHGKALRAGRTAPSCVTCHGSHSTQKASIDIINQQLCSKCHSYERAQVMKQALFLTEKKFNELEQNIQALKQRGIYTAQEEKSLFSIMAEFRTLFHTVDVNLVTQQTDAFGGRLDQIAAHVEAMRRELASRRNFAGFLLLCFAGMGVVLLFIIRGSDD